MMPLQTVELFHKLDSNKSGDITVMELRKDVEAVQQILPVRVPVGRLIAALNKVQWNCDCGSRWTAERVLDRWMQRAMGMAR